MLFVLYHRLNVLKIICCLEWPGHFYVDSESHASCVLTFVLHSFVLFHFQFLFSFVCVVFFGLMADQEVLANPHIWLNNALLERILSKPEEPIEIKRFDVQPALVDGENYSSQLSRVSVHYVDKNGPHLIRLIVKSSLGDKLVRSRNVFAKEIYIYQEVVPQIENLLKSSNISTKLSPK